MGDSATFSNEQDFAKGKGKAEPTNEMSMDDDSSSESEPELVSLQPYIWSILYPNANLDAPVARKWYDPSTPPPTTLLG